MPVSITLSSCENKDIKDKGKNETNIQPRVPMIIEMTVVKVVTFLISSKFFAPKYYNECNIDAILLMFYSSLNEER